MKGRQGLSVKEDSGAQGKAGGAGGERSLGGGGARDLLEESWSQEDTVRKMSQHGAHRTHGVGSNAVLVSLPAAP